MAFGREQIAELKKQYPKDTRIFLRYMNGEPSMPEGLRGSIKYIDDIGQIHVNWDNGSRLALAAGEDGFRKLTFEEESAEWLNIKFYSPLLVQAFEVYDSEYISEHRTSVRRNMADDVKYLNDIKGSLETSINDYLKQEEFFIGNTENKNLDGNLTTLNLSVEKHNNKLWGVIELNYTKPLSPNQINTLKSHISDEYEIGWGAHFSLINIPLKADGRTRLNVHFWQWSDD